MVILISTFKLPILGKYNRWIQRIIRSIGCVLLGFGGFFEFLLPRRGHRNVEKLIEVHQIVPKWISQSSGILNHDWILNNWNIIQSRNMHSLIHTEQFPESISTIDSNDQFITVGDLAGTTSIWKVDDITPWRNELFHQILPTNTSMGAADSKLEPSDSNELYLASLDSTIKKYHLETDNVSFIQTNAELMGNYRLDTNGETLLSAGEQGKITVFDKATLAKLSEIKVGDDFITSLHRMKDGRMIATGNIAGCLSLVNLKKDNKVGAFPIHNQLVRGVKIIENNFEVVTVSDDKLVKVFDINKEQVYLSFSEHSKAVTSLDIHPKEDHLFITGGMDKTVRIWDTRQKGSISKYEMSSGVWSIKYWRTGRTFLAGLEDGTLGIYSL